MVRRASAKDNFKTLKGLITFNIQKMLETISLIMVFSILRSFCLHPPDRIAKLLIKI
jgi:hypothetical protein